MTGGRRRLPLRVAVIAVAAAALVGVAAGGALDLATRSSAAPARPAPALPKLHGQAVWPTGARPAPRLGLLDQRGHRVTLASVRGRPFVLAFLDSRCRQVCPLEGRALSWAIGNLPAASRPALVVVSVDPWADTRQSAVSAARRWGFRGRWHWLLGTPRQLAPVWAAYHVFVKQTRSDIVHTDAVYLIDSGGSERAGYLYPFPPASVAHDLRVLSAETARAG